ncbi:hypothetical protein O6H91_05G063000 [Diphasiastrum complanatum]|uniref:Uncharacterized protein n=4 Tax=Diphasiastrum complanatum TaxID=34168 RepID=A0ACC2DNV5_DIPCM|nr:hypothetical protein O6H91_05G063000 [Diphasiastrum complanatum]KAJ7555961.1 hypothetical protein O6H91_05G063000 [Diphasiastrum complanatum]
MGHRIADSVHLNSSKKVQPFPWGDMPEEEYYRIKKVQNKKERFKSPRGPSLFTQRWLPVDQPPKAIIFMCHGYGNDISWTFQQTAIFFTQMGCGAFAIDLEGHGQSEGLRAYLPNLNDVAKDCQIYFESVKREDDFRGLPCFLYGESLGGALCLLLHFFDPEGWDGAILVAPMCKISDSMWPPWPLPELLKFLAYWAPTWPVVPSKDIVDKSMTDPAKRELSKSNPRRYGGRPRLGTAAELLRATADLTRRLKDVTLPFIVLHGDADTVTDPSVSRALYESAASGDKTLKMYEGARHALLQGESDENVARILEDIAAWLKERVDRKNKY